MVIHQRLHLVDVLRLVDGHGEDLDAGLCLPVGIDFADSIQLTVAGLTPRGKEVNDKGFPVVRQRGNVHTLSPDSLQGDSG